MASLVTTKTLELSPEDQGEILARVSRRSAFQAAGTYTETKHRGKVVRSVGSIESAWVDEGEDKPVLDNPVRNFKLVPKKQAFIFVQTEEAAAESPEVVEAITKSAPGVFAKTLDRTAAGVAGYSAEEIEALGEAGGTVELGGYSGVAEAFATATAAGEDVQWVISSSLRAAIIRSATESQASNTLVQELLTQNTLFGAPVHVFSSTEAVGYVGDFANLTRWSIVGNELTVRTETSGNVTDSFGVTHNLTQQNKEATFVEGWFSWAVAIPEAFVRLTAAAAPESGE